MGVIIFILLLLFFTVIVFVAVKSESITEEKISNYESNLEKISKEIEITKIKTVFNGEEYHYINSKFEIEKQYVHFTMGNIKIDNSLGNKIIVKIRGNAYIEGDNIRKIREKKKIYFGYSFYEDPEITTYMSEETYTKSGL